MVQVIAARNCAFGNGTRRSGFVFADVEFIGENKVFQLLKEVRDPALKSVEKLTTAKVKLAESVTKREFAMVLNNPAIMKVVDAVASVAGMNQKDAIKAALTLSGEALENAELMELDGKNRPKVIEAIEARKAQLKPTDDWKLIDIASLEIAEETVTVLDAAGVKVIGDVKAYVDSNGDLPEGLSDEQKTELMAAIKTHAK